jgi:hypothetical protein
VRSRGRSPWWLALAALGLPQASAALTLEARWIDERGQVVDPVQGGLSMIRSPPTRLPETPGEVSKDEGAFRLVLAGGSEAPEGLRVRSERPDGKPLDWLDLDDLQPAPCPVGFSAGRRCYVTPPLRLALDADDRRHPASADRSLQGELEGRIVVEHNQRELLATRVVGPQTTAVGPIRWLRGRLRVFLVRERPHGPPPFGFTDGMAKALTRTQLARANAIWGQCGISFGPPDQAEITLVDPPGPVLLAVGCGVGLPAAGGRLSFWAEGREVVVTTDAGQSPASVARRAASALEKLGFQATVSDNLRVGSMAMETADVVARRRDGRLVALTDLRSTDSRLRVCVGSVDLTDGLQHFTDVDAVAGTLEERTLLRVLDDGDPRTIEVILVPSFATGGRIGESFIAGDRGSLRNMLIEDRAGVRADTVSFALAHELGHVLLDVPGHSDDFGTDTPTRLMDSDAADPSPFGPRRLTLAECERAVRQSGPRAVTPLLSSWSGLPLKGR